MAIQLLTPIPDDGGVSPTFTNSHHYRCCQIWPIALRYGSECTAVTLLGPVGDAPDGFVEGFKILVHRIKESPKIGYQVIVGTDCSEMCVIQRLGKPGIPARTPPPP